MTLDLEAIKRRVEAATPGPWIVDGERINSVTDGPVVSAWWSGNAGGPTIDPDDAAFIAAARTDVPELIAAIKRLRERVEFCESVLKKEGYE